MPEITLLIDGSEVRVPPGTVVAAAVALVGATAYRHSVQGMARAPLCGMGICYECRVTINGQPNRLSCTVLCEDGMQVKTG